ncbi:MAG: AraC family transcriptional regulator [Chitinophagaceae bacterium]
MKVLQFTIPVSANDTVITQQDILPHFYPYLHRHPEVQLTWVQKGEGTLLAGNSMHTFAPNEIYWFGPNQPHLFKSDAAYFSKRNKKTSQSLSLFFKPDGRLQPLLDLPELKNVQKFLAQYPSGFKLPEQYVAEIASLMTQVGKTSGIERFIVFIEIFRKLLSYGKLTPLSSTPPPTRYSEHDGIKIGQVYNYIIQYYNKSITLEDVAKQAHMTPQAFCRYFKKHTRQTFVAFLNEMRINEACKQLIESDYDSIGTIAYNCGFNSITNFNRVFKSVTKLTPSRYMEKVRSYN